MGSSAIVDEAPTTRERLLRSAAELLAERGSVDAISLRAIAAGAGVSPTAVYRHFTDYAELLDALAVWCWHEFDQAVFGDERRHRQPTLAAEFRVQGQAYLAFATENPAIYGLLFNGSLATVSRPGVGQVVYDKLADAVRELLAEMDDDRDPYRVAAMVHSWIHGIATLRLPPIDPDDGRCPPTPEELLDELAIVLGLVPR